MMTPRQTLNVKSETMVKSLVSMRWGLGWTAHIPPLTCHTSRQGDQAANR